MAMTHDSSLQPDGEQTARRAGLVYVGDDEPGYARRARGDGFVYIDPDGDELDDADELARIRALAVPPAWTDVWICMRPDGHIQATGRDARGRKQYRYHPDWAKVRDAHKFARIVEFGAALPKLRRRLRQDLKPRGWPREKAVAIVISVMARTLVRVGNDAYAKQNRSFGLTTLRNRHVEFLRGGRASFHFRGKSGQAQEVELDDASLVKLVKRCQELPGQALFQYVDDDGQTHAVGSADVNDYLREAMGDEFTAKDFRTWGGTLAAIQAFAATEVPAEASQRELAGIEKAVVTEVAELLGNTPAVCRKAYIEPTVFEAWRDGRLQRACAGASSERDWELAALKFLRAARRAAERELRRARSRAGKGTKTRRATKGAARPRSRTGGRKRRARGK